MIGALLNGVTDSPVNAITVGEYWICVRTDSAVGLTATQRDGVDAVRAKLESGHFADWSLRRLAELARSISPAERALGLAAINASYNHEPIDGSDIDGLANIGASGRCVVIGRFPKLDEKIPNAQVIELDPGPDDYPAEAADTLIPGCDALVITSSTLGNGTLAGLLALVDTAFVTLVGPGTPLSPVLFDHGIDRLAGYLPVDHDRIEQAIKDGGGVKAFKPFGRNVTLEKTG